MKKKTKEDPNNFEGWAKVIKELGEKRNREDIDWSDSLSIPDTIWEDLGFWNTPDGIVTIRRYPNGKWIRHSIDYWTSERTEAFLFTNFSDKQGLYKGEKQ